MRNKSKNNTASDLSEKFEVFKNQFRNLDPKDPSLWPLIPRVFLFIAIAVGVLIGAWFAYLNTLEEDLKAEQQKETTLQQEFSTKMRKAAGLEALKAQRELVQQYVTQLEKQLPNKAEMAALLSDVNHAGMGRGLQFDLFRPDSESIRDYYAELPITLRISGRFHDMGAFVSDVAHLSRIVTINDIALTSTPKGTSLVMDAQARTYRYLDPEEIQAQQAEASKKKKGGKK